MPDSTGPNSTQGVPSHGNGGLVAMGVIMLLLAGGLVFWKSQSSDKPEEIVEEAPKAAPKPAPSPVFENAPPPPPEEEEVVEEEKKPTGPAPIGSGVKKPTGPPGCENECPGTATPALQSALGARGAMARSCYMTALRNNPTLEGKMTMSVKINPSGTVCSAYASSNSLGDQAVASCAAAKFRAGTFPAPTGGCVNVNVPLNFTKK